MMDSTENETNINKINAAADYLRWLLRPALTGDLADARGIVCSFPGDPSAGAWGGSPFGLRTSPASLGGDNENCYYCISVFFADDKGRYRRQGEQFVAAAALMVDDVGTGPGSKVHPASLLARLKPSAIIETSPGNSQWVYAFREPVRSKAAMENLQAALLFNGLRLTVDPGMMSVTRYGRLPCGINGKSKYNNEAGQPWRVRLTMWEPELRYTPAEINDAFVLGMALTDLTGETSGQLTRGKTTGDGEGGDAIEWGPDAQAALEALEALGRVKGATASGGYDITCPWIETHTDRADSGTALLPGGGFRCHHGHCEDRTRVDLHAWLAEQGYPVDPGTVVARALGDLAAATGMAAGEGGDGGMFVERAGDNPKGWLLANIITLTTGGYYDKSRQARLPSRQVLDALYGHLATYGKGGRVSVMSSAKIAAQVDKLVADGVCWHPGVEGDGAIVDFGGRPMVNTYAEPTAVRIARATPDVVEYEREINAWLGLVRWIAGEHADLLLDHLAFTVQRPGVKIRWQILIHGAPRTGKTVAIGVALEVLGEQMRSIRQKDLDDGWGDAFLRRKAICFEELYDVHTGRYNDIKTLLANSDTMQLNIKFGGQVAQANTYSIYMLSNYPNAVTFSADDNKILVIHAPDEPPYGYDTPESRELFAAVWALREPACRPAVARWLLARDVSRFQYGSLPVRTAAMHAMCAATKPDYVHHLEEMIECRERPFDHGAVRLSDIRAALREEGYKFGNNGVAAALRALGWDNYQGQKKVEGRNVAVRFWAEKAAVGDSSAADLHAYWMANPAR